MVISLFKRLKMNSLIREIEVPTLLGYKKVLPLEQKILQLEVSLEKHFGDKVKRRFMEEHKKTSSHEYNLLYFELKRFFFICSLLKNVPMFSPKVDDIWHEMLMFTKDYESFSNEFFNQFLHHEPVEVKVKDRNGRAFFDLIYTQLFEMTTYTEIAWGKFYKNPLNRDLIKEIKSSSYSELKKKYFRVNADDVIINVLIQRLKDTVNLTIIKKNFDVSPIHFRNPKENCLLLTGAMIFFSYYENDNYDSHMVSPQEASGLNNSSSGCSTFSGCSSSSCGSSCGGGCGSS